MKTILHFAAAAIILAFAGQSHAIEFISPVTKEKAKKLGLEIRATASGPDAVRVELEFESKGELEKFLRVALEVYEGDKGEKCLLSSTLKEEKSKEGRVIVAFTANRKELDKLTLRVVALDKTATRIGYWIKVKEFVDLEKVR